MLNTAATIIPDPACAPARAPAGSPANSPWTAERIEQLRNGVSSGLTCSQIAAEIGVTRNAVIGKIHRLGLSPGRPAAPARSCPPRVRPPRHSPQRQFLRLMCAQAPGLAFGETEPAAVESLQRCTLLELAPGQCRWPVGDPCAADFAYC
ncbi:MAG: GcrA family cell cycle regulator, partial [Xanthobacteraceae bacterium]